MAHSLGNMLASASISLYRANVDTYFIIDDAVAKEAFNPGEAKENNGGMERVEWDDYCYEGTTAPDFLFSSDWFRLFVEDPNDPRGKLTWRGLFQDMNGATCYNFYSSGEEVLNNITHDRGNLTLIDDVVSGTGDISLYSWGCQEKLKGRMLMNGFIGSNYAGWGFNGYYYSNLGVTHISPGDAQNIDHEELKTRPFFCDSPSELFSQDAGTAQTYALNNRFAILAKAIPARSFAIGRNPISKTGFTSQDMMGLKSGSPNTPWWPGIRKNENWRHSDFKNVAYLYTFNVYKNIVNSGGLK